MYWKESVGSSGYSDIANRLCVLWQVTHRVLAARSLECFQGCFIRCRMSGPGPAYAVAQIIDFEGEELQARMIVLLSRMP